MADMSRRQPSSQRSGLGALVARPVILRWEEGGGRRDSEPVPGDLELGASGLLVLRLVAATSAHAWRSGPVVPTAVAAPRTTGTQGFTSHRTRPGTTVPLAAGRRGRML